MNIFDLNNFLNLVEITVRIQSTRNEQQLLAMISFVFHQFSLLFSESIFTSVQR